MRRAGGIFDTLVVLAVLLAVWEAAYLYVGDSAVSSPLATIEYGASFALRPSFTGHLSATMGAFGYAVLLSLVLGVGLGLLFGVWRFTGDVAEPILVSLYTIPKITLYPLVLLIFGLGIPAKIAFGVMHGIIPVILFTQNAVRNMRPVLIKTARTLKLSPWQTMTTLLAPSIAPELSTGVRAGFSLTLLGVLIGEMFASQQGLGFLIVNGLAMHNVEMTTFAILVVVVFAVAANGLLLAIDRRFLRGGS